jgi:hypothetical protein
VAGAELVAAETSLAPVRAAGELCARDSVGHAAMLKAISTMQEMPMPAPERVFIPFSFDCL